jgi:hypothetical protein
MIVGGRAGCYPNDIGPSREASASSYQGSGLDRRKYKHRQKHSTSADEQMNAGWETVCGYEGGRRQVGSNKAALVQSRIDFFLPTTFSSSSFPSHLPPSPPPEFQNSPSFPIWRRQGSPKFSLKDLSTAAPEKKKRYTRTDPRMKHNSFSWNQAQG